MEKRQFVHSFVLVLVLFAAMGIIFFSSNINFTGLAVFNEYGNKSSCEAAGHTWEDLTENNCTTITTCTNETSDCEPCLTYENINGTQGNCISWTSCTNSVCTDDEQCVPVVTGGQCIGDVCDSSHLSLCSNKTTCNSAGAYWYDSTCNADEQCIPETCESLSYSCGSVSDGCESTLDCGSCDSGYTCNSGTCEADETEEETEDTAAAIPTTTIINSNTVQTPSCIPNWQCGDWQECIEGTQVRACTDVNICDSSDGMPETSQSCVAEIKETCFDGIKNQDEQNVDCGGSCEKKCSFFTIVGSAVSGPIDAGKKFVFEGMFGNITKTIISIISLVLLAGGFIAAGFFLNKKKGIKKLDKAIDNLDNSKE